MFSGFGEKIRFSSFGGKMRFTVLAKNVVSGFGGKLCVFGFWLENAFWSFGGNMQFCWRENAFSILAGK